MLVDFNFVINLILFILHFTFLFSITSVTRVYGIIYLIISYILVSIIIFLLGYSFLSIALIIVYAGAISIFFIFLVMLVDTTNTKLYVIKKGFTKIFLLFILPFLCGYIIMVEIFSDGFINSITDIAERGGSDGLITIESPIFTNIKSEIHVALPEVLLESDIKRIGFVMYTWYCLPFLLSGFLLLIAIFGLIAMTNVIPKTEKARQDISIQLLHGNR
jgi:NADH-quinone oxidoreductase subunit J